MLNVHRSVLRAVDAVELLRAAAPPICVAGGAAAPPVVSESPVGNTGDGLTKVLSVGLDWLSCTFPEGCLDHVRSYVESALGPATDRDFGLHFYNRSAVFETGAVLLWDNRQAPGCLLKLNGQSLGQFSESDLLKLVQVLHRMGAHWTRVDVRADVPRSMLSMDQVHVAGVAQQFVGFKRYDPRRPVNAGKLEGDSAYFGRRGSDGSGRFVRFYDKGLESGGEIDCVRFECEYSGEVARALMMVVAWCDSVDVVRGKLGSALSGAIDFRDRSGAHGHVDRMARLSWWAAVVDALGAASVFRCERSSVPLQRSLEWLADTFCRKFALAYEVVESQGGDGDEFIHRFTAELVKIGKNKLDNSKLAASVFLGIDVGELFSRLRGDICSSGWRSSSG